MRHRTGFALCFILGLLAWSCSKEPNSPSSDGSPSETDGRTDIYNDDTYLNTDNTDLNDSVIVDPPGVGKRSGLQAFSMKLIAQINPPKVSKQSVQATSVSLNGSYAYISYNMVGNPYLGAIDVVSISGSKARTVSRATFTDTDVSSVVYFNNKVYLAEATSSVMFYPPATIEVLKLTSGKLTLKGNYRGQLTSYVATCAAAENGKIYATTGNAGGLFTLTQDSLKFVAYTPLTDARWVDTDANDVVVVQGGGKLSTFDINTGSLLNTYTFTGTGIAESKSTVRVLGGKALIAAGDGGVVLMNLATGKVVGSIPRTIVSGLDPSLSVTNAVDASGQYIYISNGEAGVYVAQASQALENLSGDTPITLTVLGKLRFSNQQSVNHVAFNGSTLVIASGLGGVKVVTVTF
ncbi:MAG TPA: hypothetical protein VMM37_03545 [Bacteroidota bacterium]|nr:hypothetical protein [Bacteroidota bacterium]